MTTGEKIKEIRKLVGISQKELGDKLGVTQVMISAYEKGLRNPKRETLQKIADVLDVSIDTLYDTPTKINVFRPEFHESIDLKNNYLKSEEIDILNHFKKLNKKGHEKAIELVELLTKIPEFQQYTKNAKEPSQYLAAAHERTDIDVTENIRKHDDDIMMDDSEWE